MIGVINTGCQAAIKEWKHLADLDSFDRLARNWDKKCIHGGKFIRNLQFGDAEETKKGPNMLCVEGKMVDFKVTWIVSRQLSSFQSGNYVG